MPWPTDQDNFWQLVALGAELREIHLMKHGVLGKSPVTYPAPGDNVITRKLTKTSPGWVPNVSSSAVENAKIDSVHINDTQYFSNVPKTA